MSKTSKGIRVRKNMRLRQELIDQAKRILGTKTETETVEQALELVTFREEVLAGIESIAGTNAVDDVFRNERA